MRRRASRAFRPRLDELDDRNLLSALTPAQVTQAYGLNGITFNLNGQAVKGDGSGQIITLVEAYHDPNLAADLQTFDRAFNLPAPYLVQKDLAGSATDDGWAQEETLDVEWAHAIAPGAQIIVVEAASAGFWDLMSAINWARSVPRVSAVSMSWGGVEFSTQSAFDVAFTTPAGHTGITFIASSGDSGVQGGVEWPSSSPNVLAVGGTTLQIGSSGGYAGESVWSGSSGGSSSVVGEPSYQYSLQNSGARTTPDVAFDGDPKTGVYVYTTSPSNGIGSWAQVGGTSLGAPAWAGIIAIVDQGRAAAGKGSLDGATQTLPALYSLSAADFRKVATASSGFRSQATATAGLGTPNGAALVNGLIATRGFTGAATPAATPATTRAAATSSTGTLARPTSGLQPANVSDVYGRPASVPFQGVTRPRVAFTASLRRWVLGAFGQGA